MPQNKSKQSTKGNYLELCGVGGVDILILNLWEYIWKWADRLLEKIPGDVGITYQLLENHGSET